MIKEIVVGGMGYKAKKFVEEQARKARGTTNFSPVTSGETRRRFLAEVLKFAVGFSLASVPGMGSLAFAQVGSKKVSLRVVEIDNSDKEYLKYQVEEIKRACAGQFILAKEGVVFGNKEDMRSFVEMVARFDLSKCLTLKLGDNKEDLSLFGIEDDLPYAFLIFATWFLELKKAEGAEAVFKAMSLSRVYLLVYLTNSEAVQAAWKKIKAKNIKSFKEVYENAEKYRQEFNEMTPYLNLLNKAGDWINARDAAYNMPDPILIYRQERQKMVDLYRMMLYAMLDEVRKITDAALLPNYKHIETMMQYPNPLIALTVFNELAFTWVNRFYLKNIKKIIATADALDKPVVLLINFLQNPRLFNEIKKQFDGRTIEFTSLGDMVPKKDQDKDYEHRAWIFDNIDRINQNQAPRSKQEWEKAQTNKASSPKPR